MGLACGLEWRTHLPHLCAVECRCVSDPRGHERVVSARRQIRSTPNCAMSRPARNLIKAASSDAYQFAEPPQ